MNKELEQELQAKFEEIKKELNIKAAFKDLDDILFLKDMVAKEGFVSERFDRQLCHRIVDLFGNWNGFLHNIVLPHPSSMVNMEESKMFSEEEKGEFIPLMNKIMEFVSKNTLIGLTKNKQDMGLFIDESLAFWNKLLNPKIIEIMTRINKEWAKRPGPK